MVFVTAKRDGERDHNLLKYEHISRINKYKWLKIGFIIVLLTIIPELFLIINKLKIIEGNLLLLYAFLNGVKYPLVLIMAKNLLISQITFFMIFILISCCLPLPAVGYFGYYSGYKLIDIKSKIMYE
jgi:hypothetical protein